MDIDVESINKHLELLRSYISDLFEIRKGLTLEEFKNVRAKQYEVLHPLLLAIQSCMDIGNHIIAELSLRRPETGKDIFVILSENDIIPKQFEKTMVEMAKIRHRLVHLYWKVELDTVYEILQKNLNEFNKFADYIRHFIESNKSE